MSLTLTHLVNSQDIETILERLTSARAFFIYNKFRSIVWLFSLSAHSSSSYQFNRVLEQDIYEGDILHRVEFHHPRMEIQIDFFSICSY